MYFPLNIYVRLADVVGWTKNDGINITADDIFSGNKLNEFIVLFHSREAEPQFLWQRDSVCTRHFGTIIRIKDGALND